MKPKVSVVIVNWNTLTLLKECLNSIINNQSRPKVENKLEVIVVDNGSRDGSRKYLEQLNVKSEKLKVILNEKNSGFAKANNQGIKVAQGEYIMLLNSDTIVKQGALKTLVDYLDKHSKVAGVSPQLLNKDGSKQIDYYMKFPNLWQIIFYHNYPLRVLAMNTPIRYLFTNPNKYKPFDVDQLPGAALVTDKEVIDSFGDLDENFNFFFEDVDWCFRIRKKAGKKLKIIPSAQITHYGGASWKKWLEKNRLEFYSQYYLSLLKFVEKNYKAPLIFYQIGLTFSFSINLFFHSLLLSFKKAKVQLNLIATIWSRDFDFQLPE